MASKPLVAGAALDDMTPSAPLPVANVPDAFQAGSMPSALVRRGEDGVSGGRQRGADQRRVAVLARALEAEVIPRLVLSRVALAEHRGDSGQPGPGGSDIEALTALAIKGDLSGASALVGAMRARDIPLERIYLEVFAPVARHLGLLWEEDRADFASVTIGLCCLQQLVLSNSHAFGPRPGRRAPDRRILLAPVPGEQHSFGLVMVGEFFRRQGWDVCSATGATASELVATARKQWFSVIGLSLAGEGRLEALAALIREIRRASRNPHVGVLVGGRIFTAQPELAAMVGADATSSDAQQAVLKAETLLALLAPAP